MEVRKRNRGCWGEVWMGTVLPWKSLKFPRTDVMVQWNPKDLSERQDQMLERARSCSSGFRATSVKSRKIRSDGPHTSSDTFRGLVSFYDLTPARQRPRHRKKVSEEGKETGEGWMSRPGISATRSRVSVRSECAGKMKVAPTRSSTVRQSIPWR